MEIRMAKAGPPVAAVADIAAQMQRQLPAQQAEWIRQLRDKPETFADLERRVHGIFQQMADQMVAGLLAEATSPAEWAHDEKKRSRRGADETPLGRDSAVDAAALRRLDAVGQHDLLWTDGTRR